MRAGRTMSLSSSLCSPFCQAVVSLAKTTLTWYIPRELRFVLFGRCLSLNLGRRFFRGRLAAGSAAFLNGDIAQPAAVICGNCVRNQLPSLPHVCQLGQVAYS